MISAPEVMGVEERDRARLIEWLDDGLRGGRRGRLEAEYPVSLTPSEIATHRVVRDGDELLSHGMYHVVDAHAPMPVRVGMIGLVYTDPGARGRGLARLCIEACCEALEYEGATIALLWSDKPDFYARLDFHPFGEETRWIINAEICRDARRALGEASAAQDVLLDAPQESDWPDLEKLYSSKRFRVERAPGALAALAAAPETVCVIARRGGRAVAYAALGRGDDFQGVIHEWAGSPEDVLACFEGLCLGWGPLLVHAGPEPGPIGPALERSGAGVSEDSFALARILEPKKRPPASFYLWGFDSI